MSTISFSTGISHLSDGSWAASEDIPVPPPPPPPPPDSALDLVVLDGTVDITVEGTTLELIVSDTTDYDGTYMVDLADLALGPVNLVPPAIMGTPEVGETLSVRDGLWLYQESDVSAVLTHRWMCDGVPLSGQSGTSYVVTPEDRGTILCVREELSNANGSRTVHSAEVAIPPGLQATPLGAFQSTAELTDQPVFTLDLSGYGPGDRLIVFYGTNAFATGCTLDGIAMAKISIDSVDIGAARMTAFEHVLTTSGNTASSISVELPRTTTQHVVSFHVISGGEIVDIASDKNADGSPVTVSVTPDSPSNIVLACAMGFGFVETNLEWTGVDMIALATMPTATTRDIAIATRQNVPATPYDVTAVPSSGSHTGLIALVISEV